MPKVKPIVLDISKIFNILFLFPKLRNAFTELNGFKSLNVTGFRYYNLKKYLYIIYMAVFFNLYPIII